MRFYYILHKNSIDHLLRTSRDYYRPPPPPPPKVLEKKWTLYLLYFYVHFRKVFVEFVVLLTEIWPKNIDFYRYSKMLERGLFRGLFLPPPPPPPIYTMK